MNKLWTALLYKAIQALLAKDWNSVVFQVGVLMDSKKTGEEKRTIAFNTLRQYGIDCATWLLYAAIELAYGQLKEKQ